MTKRIFLKTDIAIIGICITAFCFPHTTCAANMPNISEPDSYTAKNPVTSDKIDPEVKQKVLNQMRKMPLPFIENRGQLNSQVAYYIRASQGSVFLTRNGEIVFDSIKTIPADQSASPANQKTQRHTVFKLVPLKTDDNLNRINVQGRKKTQAVINYFKGKKKDWIGGIPTYNEVVYDGLFKDTRVIYRAGAGLIEDVYQLTPGANPSLIRFQVEGADNLRVDATGALQVKTAAGEFIIQPPFAFQEINGQKIKVPCRFDVEGMQFGFKLDDYDKLYALVIDPQLVYGTFFAGVFN
ncbi:hypothetical protein QUF90_27105 [Desulfococcaceae bacterium HSG9]|nr:hypothetical protein [Desulfococcaceae bacterium HSG9]